MANWILNGYYCIIFNGAWKEHTINFGTTVALNPEVLAFKIFIQEDHILFYTTKHRSVAAEEAAFLPYSHVHIYYEIFC